MTIFILFCCRKFWKYFVYFWQLNLPGGYLHSNAGSSVYTRIYVYGIVASRRDPGLRPRPRAKGRRGEGEGRTNICCWLCLAGQLKLTRQGARQTFDLEEDEGGVGRGVAGLTFRTIITRAKWGQTIRSHLAEYLSVLFDFVTDAYQRTSDPNSTPAPTPTPGRPEAAALLCWLAVTSTRAARVEILSNKQ